MTRQELTERSTVDHAALAALVQRIRARQERQEVLWRRPIQPAAVEGFPAVNDRPWRRSAPVPGKAG